MQRHGIAVGLIGILASAALGAPSSGPALHLPFDGNVEPAVGRNLGKVVVRGKPSFVPGRHGQAIALADGAHLIVPLPKAVRQGQFSIAFWMKPLWHPKDKLPHPILDVPPDPKTVDKVGWAPRHIFVGKGWSETIAPNHLYGVVDAGVAMRHLKPGHWTHFVLVWSASGKFTASYINGEGSRQLYKPDQPLNVFKLQMWVGSRVGGHGQGDIVLDDLRVYGRALGPEEVAKVAGVTFPPPRDYSLLGTTCDPAKAVETPHVTWAKPLTRGPVRVICISEGKRARDFIELAQRVDVEPIVIGGPGLSKQVLANPETFAAMGKRVEQRLAKGNVDGVLVAAFGWNLLPTSTRTAIMGHVRAGGGLVLVEPMCVGGPGIIRHFGNGVMIGWANTPEGQKIERLVGRLDRPDEEYLTGAVPWEALPSFRMTLNTRRPASLFRGARVGKGRVLIYDIQTGSIGSCAALTPGIRHPGEGVFDAFEYDYQIGAAARAVLWACGRAGDLRIAGVACRDFRTEAQITIGRPAVWTVELVNGRTKPVRAKLTLTVRPKGPDAPTELVRDLNLRPGTSRITIAQPIASTGRVFADARLRVDGKVADWASTAVHVQRGNPWFIDLSADREVYTAGQTACISAKLVLRTYSVAPGRSGELRWRLYDAFGRMVERGVHPVALNANDEFPVRTAWHVPALAPESLFYQLVVDVLYKGQKTDQRTIALRRYRTRVDDFVLTCWGNAGRSAAASLATIVLRDRYGLGCTGTYCIGAPIDRAYTSSLEWLNRHNLQPWVYSTHIGGGMDKEKRRTPDLLDPSYQRKLHDRMARLARVTEPYSPLYYSLGDETRLGCPTAQASGHEQAAFRNHLRTRYGKVESLNKACATSYKGWREVVIPPHEDLTKGKFGVLTTELIAFRESGYANLCAVGTQAVHSVAPNARVGVEGVFGLTQAYGGYDYVKLGRATTFMGMYPAGMEMNMVRSFQKPGDLLGAWWNYSMLDRDYSRYAPWHLLLRGSRTLMWFTTYCASWYTALNPDFTPFDQFQWTHEELAPILNGIGKLVLGLDRDDLGLAVLHEQRNLDRCSPHFLAMVNITALLDDLGLQHDFVSGQQVAEGRLLARRAKVLVLPGQFVMRRPTAEAIRQFVAAGGAVVANIRPAGSDGLRRYDKPLLNSLFVDPAKLPKSADAPAGWAARQTTHKQGKTLLTGPAVLGYMRHRMKPGGRALREGLRRFLGACGVKPVFDVRPADGSFQPTTVVTYHDGDARYVAMQRDYMIADASPRPFDCIAPGKAHLYDVIAGRYLGESDRARLRLEVARGAMVAMLPYKVEAIHLRGLGKQRRQGDRIAMGVALVTTGARPGGGVFRIDVLSPTGRRIAPLTRKVRWTGGVAKVDLRIAFNDPVGAWTVRVTDIATGVTAKAAFELAATKP